MIEIRIEDLFKVFRSGPSQTAAVDGVTLTIGGGEFFFLLGPSGCGKTTLLRMIAGLIEPTSGRILFGGRDVTGLPVEKRNTAMVFQNYALWPHMTVTENVEFGPKMRGVSREVRRELAQTNLVRVQMESFGRRKPNQLSGGQQQRVALARALAARADCLLLDEPLSNLDARLRLHMRGELRKLVKATGATAVYVTHDQKEALSMADRIALMNAGRIVQLGTPEDLYNRPATRFVADFIGEADFITGRLVTVDPVRVETPAGMLASASQAAVMGLAAGASVVCCVRPERIGIVGAADVSAGASVCELRAAVESVIYLGEICQYSCRLSDGTMWKVSALARASSAFRTGSEVRLRVAPEDVAVLTE
jgi:iron(III) transport system ATP-binding protein